MLARGTVESENELKVESAGKAQVDADSRSSTLGSQLSTRRSAPVEWLPETIRVRCILPTLRAIGLAARMKFCQVKDKDKVVEEVRMRDVSHVALFGNIQISNAGYSVACRAGDSVTYFSMGGWFYGITRGHEMKNVFLRMEQFRLARDGGASLSLARQIVHGKIATTAHDNAESFGAPQPALMRLKRGADDALAAGSLEELLGIEGAAASQVLPAFQRHD